jgi:hypothetical protein
METNSQWYRIDKSNGQITKTFPADALRAARGSFHNAAAAVASGEFQTPFAVYTTTEQRVVCDCGNTCSTHPDEGNSLAYCGDCGGVTCPDCRVEDAATRCSSCAAKHYGIGGDEGPVLSYTDARITYEAAKLANDHRTMKLAWAAMEAAPDCPKGPTRAGYASRAGKRQAAERWQR